MRVFVLICVAIQLVSGSTVKGKGKNTSSKSLRTLIDAMRKPVTADSPRTLMQDKKDLEAMQSDLAEFLNPKPEEMSLDQVARKSSKSVDQIILGEIQQSLEEYNQKNPRDKTLDEVAKEWKLIRNRDSDLPRMGRQLDRFMDRNKAFLRDLKSTNIKLPSGGSGSDSD